MSTEDWSHRRRGWDQWNHKSHRPAPLPTYQREYAGDRYPAVDKQPRLHGEKYRYQPKTRVVRETYRAQRIQPAPEANRHDTKGTPPETKHESNEKQDRKNAHGGEGGGRLPGN